MRINNSSKEKFLICLLFLMCLCISKAWAFDPFVVKDIRVQGLQLIQLGTVYTYLPIKVGQPIDQEKSAAILHTLYETGFFTDIQLLRDDHTLVIKVVERPTIGEITVTGNKEIPKEKLDEELKKLDLVEGRVFNNSVLDRVKEGLKAQYNSLGKYNARVETKVAHLTRNRVAVTIIISEGVPAKIRQIKIMGNKTYSEDTLRREFVLTTPTVLSFINGSDQYSRERLEASLEAVKSYYMDRGFVKMTINSTQVSITPDHKHVYIAVSLTEGAQYFFKGYDIKGEFKIVSKEQLQKRVTIKPGELFSRKVVSDSINNIGNALGDKGYGMPQINAEPEIDELHRQVFIRFTVHPGRQIYVRRINFIGNTKTADYVLRHSVVQEEGSLLSLSKVKESEREMRVTGFFKEVEVKTEPVPGVDDQVDLTYKVTEQQSSKITLSGGYQFGAGFIVNAGIEQPNFLGTGKSLGINFSTNNFGYLYSINYFNPYYSINNVGRGFNVYYSHTKNHPETDITNYRADRIGGRVNYSIPFDNHSHFGWGYGYDSNQLQRLNGSESTQVTNFENINGRVFNDAILFGDWTYNSFDTFPFPTRGMYHYTGAAFNLPGAAKNYPYYKLSYKTHYYFPVSYGFIVELRGVFGYGDSFTHTDNSQGLPQKVGLPFYENYYAGGTAEGEVRGYDSYELGPRDSSNNPLGGNALVSYSLGLILPPPISRPTVRTSIFLDGGQVFAVNIPEQFRGTGPGHIRYSAGVGVIWNSPFGSIGVSTAFPLNKRCLTVNGIKECDRTQPFQFNFITGF